MDGILTSGKLFSSSSSSLEYLFHAQVNNRVISAAKRKNKSELFAVNLVLRDSPVCLFALSNDSNSLHQILPKLIEDGLMELQPRCSMEVEEGQRGLKGRQ